MATEKPRQPETDILRRTDHGPDLATFWLQRPQGWSYEAGQYGTIGSGRYERAYSVVSAPHEPELEFYVELVPEEHSGHLTPLLWRLGPGDRVTLRPKAKGRFTFDAARPNQLMLATVTGIVPFISMVRDYLHKERSGHRFVIVHGASYTSELVYGDELRAAAESHPDRITYVPSISRPDDPRNAGWRGPTGRANARWPDLVSRYGLEPENTIVYACGHPGMVTTVQEQMGERDYLVRIEKYWQD